MSLEFRHIAHAYGEVRALHEINLAAPTGEITCLLGASGCGKSTLLGLAAGLLSVQRGSIHMADELLADANKHPPPEARPVGLVFQDGALFPHMTIEQNLGFGLRSQSSSQTESWLERVGLAGLGGRFPHELSGGQQQRAALARAMAPEPSVLLMDEPFANVDIVLRRQLRRECRMLLRESGTTTIMVTHDPDEALDVADRIAVMDKGRIVQFATPDDLHDNPASAAVGAIFSGSQVVSATREDGGFETAFGRFELADILGSVPNADKVDLLIEAEELGIEHDPDGLWVRDVQPTGHSFRLILQSGTGAEITAHSSDPIARGSRCRLVPLARSVRVFAQD